MTYKEFACIGRVGGKEYSYRYENEKHYLNKETFEDTNELIKALNAFAGDSEKNNDHVSGEFELIAEEKIILNSDNLKSFLDNLPVALELREKDSEICKEFGLWAYYYISEQ